MIEQQSLRYRVNIGTTSKGVPSWDVTAEVHDPNVSDEDRTRAKKIALDDADEMALTLVAKYGQAQDEAVGLYRALG